MHEKVAYKYMKKSIYVAKYKCIVDPVHWERVYAKNLTQVNSNTLKWITIVNATKVTKKEKGTTI